MTHEELVKEGLRCDWDVSYNLKSGWWTCKKCGATGPMGWNGKTYYSDLSVLDHVLQPKPTGSMFRRFFG